ncbi:MAG: aspartate carbamoyltransferase [Massilia sp.]|jgi:hypothetical protein|nr:aspartate carbamoyltransferase [Massilia sp.]
MKKTTICLATAIAFTVPRWVVAADVQRQAEVAGRGNDVMPFSLEATTHIFTKNAEGGTQRVVAKKGADAGQIKFVRAHLQEIKQQFLKGDFSGPSHIHGQDMPGLDALRSAKPAQIAIDYRDVDGGAELIYRTSDPVMVAALHKWFDAQLSDHGSDAREGRPKTILNTAEHPHIAH